MAAKPRRRSAKAVVKPPIFTRPRVLRPYQIEAADAVSAAHRSGVAGPGVVLPTGSGKTSVIAELVRREVIAGRRVLMIAHRNELIEQMSDAVVAVHPLGPAPAKIGGPHRGDPDAQVISATVQSLQRDEALARIGMRDLVIVDECFPAGTLVGGRPIETLAVGDLVTAVSSHGAIKLRPVTATMSSVPSGLVRVHLTDGQMIVCTPGHPFLTASGWTAAAKLTPGDPLHHAKVPDLKIRWKTLRSTVAYRVDRVEILEPGSDGTYGGLCPGGVVYNIEVAVDHTYTVGSGVVVHNCHHAVATTYRRVLDHFGELGARRAGFTATMIRHASAKGEIPLRDVWSEVVYERDITWAIENGFLLAPEGVTVELPDLDVDSLHRGSGEITDEEAESAMMRETTLNATVEAVLERTAGLSTIVFGASMAHCRQLAEALVALGVSAEVVVGPTSVRERTGIYSRFRHGGTRVLVTVDVLTEGADFPRCEAVVLARPTRSQSRLIQCVGRALRPHTFDDGRIKERALVVDLVGAGSLGLIAETRLDAAERRGDDDDGLGCMCPQPCVGEACDFACTGAGCACVCGCAEEDKETGPAPESVSEVPCTCSCQLAFGLCRCGCECDNHRIDPLLTFDPITGSVAASGQHRRGDSAWSTRTASIRWTRHPRGLVRPIYRQDGSKGVLVLADMRGVPGTDPGNDWAFGFYDQAVRRMFWVHTNGGWCEPGPECALRGMSLAQADALANEIFPRHMRDSNREPASYAQISLARALGVPDAEQLDRRDLSDMLAMAQADHWIPNFWPQVTAAVPEQEPAA